MKLAATVFLVLNIAAMLFNLYLATFRPSPIWPINVLVAGMCAISALALWRTIKQARA